MSMYLQSLIDGILIGGVYASIAVGLSLAFGVMRIVNFAHGEMLMVSMYITYFIFMQTGLDPYLIMILTFIIMFIVGFMLQKGVISKMLQRETEIEPTSVLLFTSGLGMVLSNLVLAIFGPNPLTANTVYTGKSMQAGSLYISVPKLISFVIAVGCTLTLYIFLKRSETGRAIRATSQNRNVITLMGINMKYIYNVSFGISIALVGISGALLIPYYPVVPTVGTAFSLKSFVIVVLGGQGNVIGALLGGLIVGIVEKMGTLVASDSIAEMIVFIVFVAVLVFRPYGLLGKKDM